MYTLSNYIAEMFPTLKHCWYVPCLITLLRCSQPWNINDVYPVLLHCCAIPNLETKLISTLSYYNAKLFQILEHCWGKACPKNCWFVPNLMNTAETYRVFLRCWDVPNVKTLLVSTLSNYLAELFQRLKHCCCLVTIQSYSQSSIFVDV